jgi:hypothetical protein
MAAGAIMLPFPLQTGQDEGTEPAMLAGGFSSIQNARYRKNKRLGKRNGYAVLASTDATAAALGNGNGRLACLGPRFCAVDDRFYRWDDAAGTWGYPVISGGTLDESRLLNRWPQFMPAPTFTPTAEQSPLNLYTTGAVVGTLLQSIASHTYAQGLLWCCWCYWANTPTADAWTAVITATNPISKLEVFRQTIPLSGAQTDNQQPFLLSTGNGTIVLVSDTFTAGAKDGLKIYLLSSRAAGFDIVAPTAFACIESAVNYYVGATDEILIAYVQTGSLTTVRVARWSTTTKATTATGSRLTAGLGNASLLSCYGVSGGTTWVGYTGSISANIAVDIFDSTLASVIGNLNGWNAHFTPAPVGPMVFTLIPGTNPAEVVGIARMSAGGSAIVSFDTTGGTNDAYLAAGVQHLSQPFAVDGKVYIWVRHVADVQLGVATLVRVPRQTEYTFIFRSVALPIEATLDDEDFDLLTAANSGPPYPPPVSTAFGFVAMLSPTVESIVTPGPVTYLLRKPLVVPVRHRSEGVSYADGAPVPVLRKHFAPGAQPMFVDARGGVEAGFVQSPAKPVLTAKLAGGNMTPASTYQYTGYYEYVDANGRTERSAPATPLVVAMGAGDTKTRVTFNALELSKKALKLRIFRTLANQTQFFQLVTIDVTPCVNAANDGSSTYTVEDSAADTVVGSNGELYTQIGQEMENAQFPACSFAMVGGNRLWTGGGFKANVVQASKQFRSHLSVEMVDDDAFRVELPGDCTGMAYLDNAVLFTSEGIYLVGGDGPDVAGEGIFSAPTRLPFSVGCNNARSVIATELGVFFQSEAGMYLLARGFGSLTFMGQIQDTIADYPHITSVALLSKGVVTAGQSLFERTVQWTALADANGIPDEVSAGRVFVFDLDKQVWTVDTFNADRPSAFLAERDGFRLFGVPSMLVGSKGSSYWHPFRLENGGFADGALEVGMQLDTGDVRPWGDFGHGVMNRVGLLGEVRSASDVMVRMNTDKGGGMWRERVFALASGDSQIGDDAYIEVALGLDEQRDVTSLRLSVKESSTSEGFSLFGFYIETQKDSQGWRLNSPLATVNVRSDALLTESGAEVLLTEDGEQLVTEDGS